MPAKVYYGSLFLGDTIQEKTRTLLGWNDEHCALSMVDATAKSMNPCDRRMLNANNSRRYPYLIPSGRLRRNSTSSNSTCSSSSSSDYSQPSPSYSITSYESLSPEPQTSCSSTDCHSPYVVPLSPSTTTTTTYRSPEREAQIFERLRQLVPMLPYDRSAYQVLIETVSQVMDLEHQLERLNEQTNNAKNSLRIEQSFVTDADNSVFPDDLKTVDVTPFKRLLCSDSVSDNTPNTTNFNFVL